MTLTKEEIDALGSCDWCYDCREKVLAHIREQDKALAEAREVIDDAFESQSAPVYLRKKAHGWLLAHPAPKP